MFTGLLTVMPCLPMHIPSVQECDATMTNRSYLTPYHNHPILKHGSSLAQRISMGYGHIIDSIVYLLVFCFRSCRGVLLCCLCLHLLNDQLSQDPPTATTPQAENKSMQSFTQMYTPPSSSMLFVHRCLWLLFR